MDALLLAVTGPVTALVLAGVQKLFQAGAKDAAKDELAIMLRGELALFRGELLVDIDEKYRTASECALISGAIVGRLEKIDGALANVDKYSHERSHTLLNEFQRLALDVGNIASQLASLTAQFQELKP